MTKARQTQIRPGSPPPPYYHCVSRYGQDEYSSRNYEHRCQWIVDRLKERSAVFTIDICAYGTMHTRTVLYVPK